MLPTYFDGAGLMKARKRKKMSRLDVTLAMRKMGLKTSERQLYRWEGGETTPNADGLLAVCRVLGITQLAAITMPA